MLERVIEDYLYERMHTIGGECIKFTSSNHRGIPDRVCLFPSGIVVFVELKAPGRKPRPDQRVVHEEFKSLNLQVVVIDSRAKVDALIKWGVRRYNVIAIHETARLRREKVCPRKLDLSKIGRNSRFSFRDPSSE